MKVKIKDKIHPHKKIEAYSFVDPRVFAKRKEVFKTATSAEKFTLITVGRPTIQKNHTYLLDAFRMLKHDNFELHIYGMGDQYEDLKQQIEKENLPVVLKGAASNIQDIIPLFIYYEFLIRRLFCSSAGSNGA